MLAVIVGDPSGVIESIRREGCSCGVPPHCMKQAQCELQGAAFELLDSMNMHASELASVSVMLESSKYGVGDSSAILHRAAVLGDSIGDSVIQLQLLLRFPETRRI